jgi:SAM-dependent methyltransferase
MRKSFDRSYYDRFYRNPRTRAVTPAAAARQAKFIAAYLRYLDLPVRRILDIGCGTGITLRALGREFPSARVHGVEYSDYLCERYGWERGSVVDYASDAAWDLVVCNDVLAYLDAKACAKALANIATLSHGAAFLGHPDGRRRGSVRPRAHRSAAASSTGSLVSTPPGAGLRQRRRRAVSQAAAQRDRMDHGPVGLT